MKVAIKIENLSKQYRLGLVSTRTLSHDRSRWWQTNILGKDDPYLKIGESNGSTRVRSYDGPTERGNDLSERSDLSDQNFTASREGNNSTLRLSASAVKDKSEINNPLHAPCPMPSREKKQGSDYIWALKDINLEVEQGEVEGIIGE